MSRSTRGNSVKNLSNVLDMALILVSSSLVVSAIPALSAPPPTQIGKCTDTFIEQVSTRSSAGSRRSVPGSSTSVNLTNGIYLVSYDEITPLKKFKVGEKVKLCLLSIPRDCPPADNRGRTYRLLSYRTRQSVKLPNSQHSCGGA